MRNVRPTRTIRDVKVADFLNRLTDQIVTCHTAKGEGTGGWSKILSGLIFLLLTAVTVELFKHGEYLALFVLLALAFTKIGSFVMFGLLAFAVYRHAWSVVALLVGYFVLGTLSFTLGKKNVKQLWLSGKPMIGP